MARRTVGVSGTALAIGTVGLYLAYVGVKDIPFMDGMRSLLRQEKPTPRAAHLPFTPQQVSGLGNIGASAIGITGKNDKGIDKLVGNARNAYPVFRKLGNWPILGWGLRPSGTSDHPRGLALDIMTTSNDDAQRIIKVFRSLPGAKYWIWNRQIANIAVDNWRVRSYAGLSPHTDHVHLSFS